MPRFQRKCLRQGGLDQTVRFSVNKSTSLFAWRGIMTCSASGNVELPEYGKCSLFEHKSGIISRIVPLFTYNDYIYDAMGIVDANKLQVIQNSCIRNCFKCHRQTPRIELYDRSSIVPLYIPRRIHTSSVVHRGLNQNSTTCINNMFNLVGTGEGRVTRSEIRSDVAIPRYRLEQTKGNITYRGGGQKPKG